MITLEKVKDREQKNNNPDQLNLFGDNGDKKNKKTKAQKYTDKINKQNKNRPESKPQIYKKVIPQSPYKKVFPGDKSGAYSVAKSDLEAKQGLKKAGASGDVSPTAGAEIRKKVETIRKTRADKLGTPDPFTTPSPKTPIKPFGSKPVTTSAPGFGKGFGTGQIKAKSMDARTFTKTQPTSDLLPKSFKDFDKKIKSLKVDTDIERRISNPKTASIIDKSKSLKPSSNPDLTARRVMGAAGSDSNFTSAEPVPKSTKSFKPSKTFLDKVRKSRKSRKQIKTIKDLNKEMGANELIKRIKGDNVKFSSGAKGKFASGSVDLGNTDAKFANRQRIKEPPKFDGQQNIFNDPNFDKKRIIKDRSKRSKISGSGQKKLFKQLQFDMNQSRKSILKTGSGERIRAPRAFKQGSVINPEIYTGPTKFDKKATSLKTNDITMSRTKFKQEFDKLQQGVAQEVKDREQKIRDAFKNAKRNATSSGPTGKTAADTVSNSANYGRIRNTAAFDKRVARMSRGFGGNRGKRAILGKIAKAAIKNPGKTGLLGAGILATNYLLTQRRDSKIRAENQRVLNSPNTPKLSIADTTFNPSGKSKKFIVGKK